LTVDVFDLNDTALPVGSLGCVLDCVEVDGVGTPEDVTCPSLSLKKITFWSSPVKLHHQMEVNVAGIILR
jgi:hypothetical protein